MSNLGNKETMSKNIQYYMELNKKTRQDICDALGFKYSTLTDWINANTYPRIDKIEKMANYFRIMKADLIEEHSIPTIKEDSHYNGIDEETRLIAQEIFDDKDMKLLFNLKKSAQSDELMSYARFLKEKYERENNL